MQKNNKFQSMIKAILYLMAFLVPIFFLPITLEAFEFNKMYLLTGLTSLCLVIWGVQVITTKELKIAKTRFLIPGLLLISSVFLSTLFSIDKTSSIFGASGRWYPSLVSFLTLGALYIVITTHLTEKKDVKTTLISFFTGTTVASIVALLSFFGVLFIKGTDENFNPTGSLITLGVLAVLAIIISIYTQIKEQDDTLKIATALALIPNFFYIVSYNNPRVWILLALGIGLLATVVKTAEIKANKIYLLVSGIIVVAVLGLTIMPVTKGIVMKHTYPTEAKLPFGESWNIAISTMRDFPIVGTGPSTFYLNYPRYRSFLMNQTDFWNARFDKPQSEALLIVSSLGILGILTAGYFIIEVIKSASKTYRKEDLSKLTGVITLLMVATMLLTNTTVLLGFSFVLFLGFMATLDNIEKTKYLTFSARKESAYTLSSLEGSTPVNENEGFLTAVLALPLVVMAVLGFITIYKVYPSEYYMQKAMEALNEDAGKSYEYQTKAIQLNPRRSNYYNTFAQTNLAIAINLSSQENITEADGQTIQNLVATAISATRAATDSINPLDPANWEVQAQVYRAIREAAQDADQWAMKALEAAIQLDPSNPRLRLELGGIYYAAEDYSNAASLFRQAINLKSDYANAYYNFAFAAKNLEDYATAKRAFELTLSLVDKDSEEAEALKKEIADLDAKLAALGDSKQKPTVEELANQGEIVDRGERGEFTEQEPLTVEGEREQFVEPVQQPISDLNRTEVEEARTELE